MSVFTDSLQAWISGLSINSVIMMIMMIFMLVGAIDKILGNKFGYGEEFENGFNAIGALALSMAGVVAAAPVLSTVLGPSSSLSTPQSARMLPCSQPRCSHVIWEAIRWLWSWQQILQSVTLQV